MIEVVKKKSTRPLQDGDLLYDSDLDMYGFIIKEDTSNYESIYMSCYLILTQKSLNYISLSL